MFKRKINNLFFKKYLFFDKNHYNLIKDIKHLYSMKTNNWAIKEKFDDHYPVMWRNILDVLDENIFNDLSDNNKKVIADLTIGCGNHSKLILETFENSDVIGIDLDKNMVNISKIKLKSYIDDNRLKILNENYVSISNIRVFDHFSHHKKTKKFDFMLLDLGYNSLQIDSDKRGLSFKFPNADLDMRYDDENETKSKASDILNHCSEMELMEIFIKFGDEKNYEALVKKIIQFRDKQLFSKVGDFLEVIDETFHSKKIEKFDSYTRLFQALRIAVNYELLNINRFFNHFYKQIEYNGIIAIITFHSLEDKIVKNFFLDMQKLKIGEVINKKPFKPSKEELNENSRSRSALLRMFKFNNKF